jgi:hypothetical protein
MSYLREAFSEDGQASSSRLMMAIHALAGIAWVTYALVHDPAHKLPDFSGVTLFVTAPYAINKFGSAASAIGSAIAGTPKP